MAALTKAQVDANVWRTLSERSFQGQVVQFAKLCGWRVWYVWNSRHSPAGWPDLFLIHPRRREVLAWELKAQGGRASKVQEETLELLRLVGIPARLLRPSDWPEIERTLRGDGPCRS